MLLNFCLNRPDTSQCARSLFNFVLLVSESRALSEWKVLLCSELSQWTKNYFPEVGHRVAMNLFSGHWYFLQDWPEIVLAWQTVVSKTLAWGLNLLLSKHTVANPLYHSEVAEYNIIDWMGRDLIYLTWPIWHFQGNRFSCNSDKILPNTVLLVIKNNKIIIFVWVLNI